MIKLYLNILLFTLFLSFSAFPQSKILIYMDLNQTDHLKAYGITYRALTKSYKADWLLNYKGGSFLIDYSDELAAECRVNNVAFETLSLSQVTEIYSFVQNLNW